MNDFSKSQAVTFMYTAKVVVSKKTVLDTEVVTMSH